MAIGLWGSFLCPHCRVVGHEAMSIFFNLKEMCAHYVCTSVIDHQAGWNSTVRLWTYIQGVPSLNSGWDIRYPG